MGGLFEAPHLNESPARELLFSRRMRRLLIMSLLLVLFAGCGARPEPPSSSDAPGPRLTDLPTSPAGVGDDVPSALPERVIQRGRQSAGNPILLGVLTATMLAAALGLGAYTLYLIHRDHRGGRL